MIVSLCVVAYNEEMFLPNLLVDLCSQTYPHELIEIVLINSMSLDNTRKIMSDFENNRNDFYSVKVVDNPARVQAAGWNIAIMEAKGDVIVRIDAHTHIPPEFTEKNMRNIEAGEFVTGGVRPCIIERDTPWNRVLLSVENSLFGSSVNKCRHGTEKTYVKTLFHAAYRREIFSRIGGFNENLLRTEDNEMHDRIRKAGYKIFFDPKIISYQYARNDLRKMMKQKFGNGYWVGVTLSVDKDCISPFHLVPFAFVCSILMTSVLCLFGLWQTAAVMWGFYVLFAVMNMVISMINNGFHILEFTMPFLFLILHICYGIGTLVGIVAIPHRYKELNTCTQIERVRDKVLTDIEDKNKIN